MRWRLADRAGPPVQSNNGELFPSELEAAIDDAVRIFRAPVKHNSGNGNA